MDLGLLVCVAIGSAQPDTVQAKACPAEQYGREDDRRRASASPPPSQCDLRQRKRPMHSDNDTIIVAANNVGRKDGGWDGERRH